MKDCNDFARECYLASEPSVDINEASIDKYEELLQQCIEAYAGKKSESKVREACNMWCLMSGPKLYEKQ